MASPTRVLYISLDACDADLAQQFAADGDMPHLAKLLTDAAIVPTQAPYGFFASANWPTIWTGLSPSRHGYICWDEIAAGTYDYRETSPREIVGRPFWERLSDAGCRVAAIDFPHSLPAPQLNGVQLVEWGSHDRHGERGSFPPAFIAEVDAEYGGYPLTPAVAPQRQHAPCDYYEHEGLHRTTDENVAFYDGLREAHRRKARLSLDLLDRGDWDFFGIVFSEAHCAGHQLWRVHDTAHVRHEADALARIGEDPLRAVYRALDATVGEHLARLGDDAVAFVHLNHGMRAQYDGTDVLDPLLWRLDQFASRSGQRGWRTRATGLLGAIPERARRPAFSRAAELRRKLEGRYPIGVFTEELPHRSERRWWSQPNNTVSGSVRLNLEDREPRGIIAGADYRATLEWLADRLLEIVSLDTGEPAVQAIRFTDDHYVRTPTDSFGDLIIEWNRNSPLERVWSPAIGVVRVPTPMFRTGDHHPGGMLIATGPGIRGGRHEVIESMHVAPTIAAAVGVTLDDVDGRPLAELLPEGVGETVPRPTPAAPRTHPVGGKTAWPQQYEVPALERVACHARALDADLRNLGAAHHTTWMRLMESERLATIATTSAWVRQMPINDGPLVSIVMATRNRAGRVATAIASVVAQTYPNWELLVVDDGSTDDTPAVLAALAAGDARIRPVRIDHGGVAAARNAAIAQAQGSYIAYLDDDNRYDPDWCKAIVWTFGEHPEAQVAYGARLVDDFSRHHYGEGAREPWMQLLPWDRERLVEQNLVDTNVLVHRNGSQLPRFDDACDYFADWDFVLQLTDDVDAMEIPVVAAYYATDAPERMTDEVGTARLDTQYTYVRDKTARRRAAGATT